MGSGFVKIAYFCYNSASSRFYREVLYGQVAQSVEQRIEKRAPSFKASTNHTYQASQHFSVTQNIKNSALNKRPWHENFYTLLEYKNSVDLFSL
jgi:hypothetical protein